MDMEGRVPAQHFRVPVLKVEGSCRAVAVGSAGSLSSEASAMVGSMGCSSSEVSVIAKSERVAMLVDGDWVTEVTGDAGIAPDSGAVTNSSGGG